MSKVCLSLITLLSIGLTVTGCALKPPANHAELCNKLKSQALYNVTNPNIEASSSTRFQRDSLNEQLKANNC